MGFLVGSGLTVVHFFLSWELTSTTRLSFAHLREDGQKQICGDVLDYAISQINSPPGHSSCVQALVILTCVSPWLCNTSCFCLLRLAGHSSSTGHKQTSSSDLEAQTSSVQWKAADEI